MQGIQSVVTLMANGGVCADAVPEQKVKSRVDFDSTLFDVSIERDHLQRNCGLILSTPKLYKIRHRKKEQAK